MPFSRWTVLALAGVGLMASVPARAQQSSPCAAPTIVGTEGDDVLVGTDGPDIIDGLGGNDVISGLGDNDLLCGGEGSDVVSGGGGDDALFGGLGVDVIQGDGGNDELIGGGGDDTISGGPDQDDLNGGAGVDDCDAEIETACEAIGSAALNSAPAAVAGAAVAGGGIASAAPPNSTKRIRLNQRLFHRFVGTVRIDHGQRKLEVCDRRADGKEISVEYKLKDNSYGRLADRNGAKGGCANLWVPARITEWRWHYGDKLMSPWYGGW